MCKKIAVPKPVKNIDAPVDSCKTQIISKKIWHITISLKKNVLIQLQQSKTLFVTYTRTQGRIQGPASLGICPDSAEIFGILGLV
jgi:hypothetical protein